MGNASSIRPRAPSHRPPSLRRGRPTGTTDNSLHLIHHHHAAPLQGPPGEKIARRGWCSCNVPPPNTNQSSKTFQPTQPCVVACEACCCSRWGKQANPSASRERGVRNDKHEGSKRTATGPISWPPGSCPSCPSSHALSRPPPGQAWNKSMPTGLGAAHHIPQMISAAAREISLPSWPVAITPTAWHGINWVYRVSPGFGGGGNLCIHTLPRPRLDNSSSQTWNG